MRKPAQLAADVEVDAEPTWDSDERREAYVAGIHRGGSAGRVTSGKTRKPRVATAAPGNQVEQGGR